MPAPPDATLEPRRVETAHGAPKLAVAWGAEAVRAIGIDGCPGGWVCATRGGVHVAGTLAEVFAVLDGDNVVGVDMPIGLPTSGVRASDRAARLFLTGRASTIFSTPPRDLITFTEYAAANAASKERHGRGISKQAFNLFARIRDLDELMSPALGDRVAEVHPECSFREMTGQLLPSKHTLDGLAQRRRAITERFGDVPERLCGAKPDDILDAYAVLWSAERFARGEHRTLGPVHGEERDDRGLTMRIVV